MINRILISVCLVFLLLYAIGCHPVPPQGKDENKRTFEEIYADYIGGDENKSKRAEYELNIKLEEYYPKLVEVAALQDPVKSLKAIEIIKEYDNDEARDVILKGLDSEHREIVIASLIASGPQKDERAFEKLMELSYSDDQGIRGNSTTAIAFFPDYEGVIRRLGELTEDSDKIIRRAAYAGLGKIADPETDHLLYDALKREAESLSPDDIKGDMTLLIISKALGRVVDEEDCEWLANGLDKTNPDELRYTLFDTLANMHCSEAVAPLISICRDIDEKDLTRFRAGFSLAFIGDPGGYKAADDIFFAVSHGELDVNAINNPTFLQTMQQYGQLLNDLEIATRMEK